MVDLPSLYNEGVCIAKKQGLRFFLYVSNFIEYVNFMFIVVWGI